MNTRIHRANFAARAALPATATPVSTNVFVEAFAVNSAIQPGVSRNSSGSGPISGAVADPDGLNTASSGASVDAAGLHASSAVYATNQGYSPQARSYVMADHFHFYGAQSQGTRGNPDFLVGGVSMAGVLNGLLPLNTELYLRASLYGGAACQSSAVLSCGAEPLFGSTLGYYGFSPDDVDIAWGLAPAVAPAVPEPSTWLLMGAGVASPAWRRRTRRLQPQQAGSRRPASGAAAARSAADMLRRALRVGALALAPLLLASTAAVAGPFYNAGVQGGADANASSRPCALGRDVSGGYRTFPNGSFKTFAEGRATAFNPCSATSGSAFSYASANLVSGQLRAYALAQIGQNGYKQEALAHAFFSDDVVLYYQGALVPSISNGGVGEIRLNISGSRSPTLLNAEVNLEISALNGRSMGYREARDLHGGESLVIPFDVPFHFFAILSVLADDGQWGDFGSTAQLAITLPEGYTFGSSSGVLLQASAIPEPANVLLFSIGLAALSLVRRRRS